MKNLFKQFSLYIAAAVSLVACDPAESEYSFEDYKEGLYTINKSTITPEFEDTSYIVLNMDEQALNTGDRARLLVRYYYDSNVTKYPERTIMKVIEVIPTYPIVAQESIDASEYNTLVTSINSYDMGDRFVSPVWVWKNRQNVNVQFKGIADGAQYAMTVIGVEDDCVNLQLHIKAKESGAVKTEKLLTFDLNDLGNLLTDSQKAGIKSCETLKTKVYVKCLKPNGEVSNVATPVSEFSNPFKG